MDDPSQEVMHVSAQRDGCTHQLCAGARTIAHAPWRWQQVPAPGADVDNDDVAVGEPWDSPFTYCLGLGRALATRRFHIVWGKGESV